MIKVKWKFHHDAGHGWLEVEKQELERFNLADKISQYSYVNGNKVYLEEDRDAGLFLKELAKGSEKGELTSSWCEVNVTEVDNGDRSNIRGMERYSFK